jgi:hypothetical protein
MARGTWQGSGTWQTGGGPDLTALIPVAVVAGVAYVVIQVIAALIWWIVGFVAVVVVAAVVLVVCRVRRGRHARRAGPVAAPVVYQVPAPAPPRLEASQPHAIEPARNELHLHFHGMTAAEAAEAIRRASEAR